MTGEGEGEAGFGEACWLLLVPALVVSSDIVVLCLYEVPGCEWGKETRGERVVIYTRNIIRRVHFLFQLSCIWV